MMIRSGLMLLLLLNLVACSMFDSEEEKPKEPAALTKFEEEVDLRRLWRVSVGEGQGKKYNRLKPAIAGPNIYVAGAEGSVVAVARDSGRVLWRNKLKLAVSGGVGVGDGTVLLGTENAEVLALSQEDGQILWRTQVASEVLSAPAGNDDVVVLQTVDGKLIGLDAASGEQIWIYENIVPALSLRGTSSPLIVGDFVIAAFANGTVLSVALDNGTLRWEQRVAIPTGRSEIERMVDVDANLSLVGNMIVVPSYQGYLAAIDAETGQKTWQMKVSSHNGVSTGFGNIYLSDENGHVLAFRSGENDAVWENDQMDLRPLSPPTAFGNFVAVGDFEGYLHLLSQVDGRFVGRSKVDGEGIRSAILVADGTIYVYGDSGSLQAINVH